ncbi:MAG: hypothetical protein GX822_01415 [Alcaligenaceae bacterium]|nr:hypothetical protein [Alcaligenaceae bacterium]
MQTLIIGAGGAGCNIVSQIKDNERITTALFNTDLKSLEQYLSKDTHQLGKQVCQGNSPVGFAQARKAINESREDIQQLIQPFTKISLVVGLGGNTGTAFTQTLIELVQQAGKELELFLIKPLALEANRLKLADEVLAEIPAQYHKNIFSLVEQAKNASQQDSLESLLKKVDAMVLSSILG